MESELKSERDSAKIEAHEFKTAAEKWKKESERLNVLVIQREQKLKESIQASTPL